ncbi:TetR family transcriptional regulator C-terminal domain-containing protein, partial [Klebsiella variicola]|uniref:TetR family transcriptional regulator C-terminal domain-containing protein n=3 Tax=Pseudomonadota TaxID=1224 RepID=UPI002730447F
AQVMPLLHADVARFERWADEGLIRRVNFTHLMFLIWSSTQAYADLAPQFALYMGKPRLEAADFEAARELITGLIWRSLE